MTTDLDKRVRDANPVHGRAVPDEDLLRRLVAEPRASAEPARRSMIRHRVVLLAAAAVLLGGTAAGVSRFAVEYFGAGDSEPTPAAVIAELIRLDQTSGTHFGPVDAESFVRLAAFDTSQGRVTIYIAPSRSGRGYCVAEATGPELGGGSCQPTTIPELKIPYGSSWNSGYGDVHPVYGRLPTGVARIDVRFQDGEIRPASVRAPWWIYVAGGDETEPGHAPTELIARDAGGAIVARQDLNPYVFMNRAAIETDIPTGDGSPEQNAVRTTLIGLGSFGAEIGPQVRLGETYLVRTVQTARGSFDVYAAPWGDGGLCFGYADHGLNFEHITSGCPSGGPVPEQPTVFDSDEIQAYGTSAGFGVVDGMPPAGAAGISVRFEDGTLEDADIRTSSYFISWFEPEQLAPGRRPEELVAWDAQGRVLDTFELDPATLRP